MEEKHFGTEFQRKKMLATCYFSLGFYLSPLHIPHASSISSLAHSISAIQNGVETASVLRFSMKINKKVGKKLLRSARFSVYFWLPHTVLSIKLVLRQSNESIYHSFVRREREKMRFVDGWQRSSKLAMSAAVSQLTDRSFTGERNRFRCSAIHIESFPRNRHLCSRMICELRPASAHSFPL